MSKILTMNSKMKRIFFSFLILMTGMAFYGCGNSSFESAPETSKTGTGYFVLTNGSAGADTETLRAQTKTIMPVKPVLGDFASYKLFFTGTGGNSGNTKDVDCDSTNLGDPVELAVGTWDLVVYAYKLATDTQPTAQGDLLGVIDIKSGGTVSENVTLTTFDSGGTGTFSWNITYPNNVTSGNASITITPLDAGGTTEQTVPLTSGSVGSRTLNSGYYRVFVELENNSSQTASLREILHIHSNMTSTFTHTFTAENFFDTLSASVSIGIQVNGVAADWTDPSVGETLKANSASLTPGTPKYQWYRGSGSTATAISGATNETYTLTPDDVGTVSVRLNIDGTNGFASDSITVVAADGSSEATAFRVYNEADLRDVGKSNAGPHSTWTLSTYYRLMKNITLTGSSWAPIGGSPAFSGTFDGGGKTIDFGGVTFAFQTPDAYYSGLFGNTNGLIKNLRLEGTLNYPSSLPNYSGNGYIGALVGSSSGTIENISSSVTIEHAKAGATNYLYLGGIVGLVYNGTIKNCYSTGNITTSTGVSGSGTHVGGIAGDNYLGEDSYINNCWAAGDVEISGGSGQRAGGIVGYTKTDYNNEYFINKSVALNSTVSVSLAGTDVVGRVWTGSWHNGTAIANYARDDMELYVASSLVALTDPTLVGMDGLDVTLSATEATDGSWWTSSGGPDWSAVWDNDNANEAKPWKWDSSNKRPILWFETSVNQ